MPGFVVFAQEKDATSSTTEKTGTPEPGPLVMIGSIALGLSAYRFSVAWPRVLPQGSGRVEQQTENRDVRVACADALRNFKTKDVARALVEVMGDKQFEVSYQARKSLVLMTGHDFRYDAGKWREYLGAAANPFSE